MAKKIEKSSRRYSNFELLRIISMLMIVVSHYFAHSGIQSTSLPLGFNRFFAETMLVGKIGVVIFMLISGYFLGQTQKKLQLSRVLKIVLQVLFYSIGIFVIFLLLNKTQITMDNLKRAFMPITFKLYWFVTAYLVIYLFHPFINRFLKSLNRRAYLTFIMTSVLLFIIIRTFTHQDFYASEVGVFLTYYAIGNYLHVYKDNFFSHRKKRVIILCVSILFVILSTIMLDVIGVWTNNPTLFNNSTTLLRSNGSIITLLIGVCIFTAIGYAKEFSSKIVNIIASTTFGIYLIHENRFLRSTLWKDTFHSADYLNSGLLVPHMIITVIAIFIGCSLIEYVRKETFEKLYDRIISPKIDRAQQKITQKFLKTTNKDKN